MPGKVERVQLERRNAGWVHTELWEDGRKNFAMQNVQPCERTTACPNFLHGWRVTLSPGISKGFWIGSWCMARQKCGSLPCYSRAPVDDGAEHVEDESLDM